MNKEQDTININNIEAQVERWDMFARLVPTVFLVINIILVTVGVIDFEQAFWVGLGLFAVTAVTWWFWTIYTIRHLVKTLNRASKNLQEVRSEFTEVAKEVKDIRNDR
jgi:type II secretory pathway component PulM|tara:strand:+ start:65 stop:388 length:324 start_codon:yes stop_codon:yes gene_type:complete